MTLSRILLAAALAGLPVMSLPASAQETETVRSAPQHSAWTRLLETYVIAGSDGVNRVDYAALKADPADRAALDAYIDSFADMDLSGTSPAAFAAWANLYNAVTVRYIVQNYPLGSIRDGYLFGGPWKKIKVTADGETVSLDEIEHKILRPRFKTPLVHYAINCAAFSCPNLQAKAWEADTLDADLTAAARAYINNPRGVTVTDSGITVSSIYDWFEADFGGSKQAVIAHLLKYADEDLAKEINANPRIRKYDYDWSLNDSQKADAE
jgi:hypothetical protein